MRQSGTMLHREVKQLTADNLSSLADRLPKGKLPVAACIAKMLEHSDSPAKVNYLLDEYECMVERELETPKMFTKMGSDAGFDGHPYSDGSSTRWLVVGRHSVDGLQHASGVCHHRYRLVRRRHRLRCKVGSAAFGIAEIWVRSATLPICWTKTAANKL